MMARTGQARGVVHAHPEVLLNLASHSKKGSGHIAPGFHAARRFDLKFEGGRTLQHLVFKNVYLGGTYPASDIQNIDSALSGAMSDPPLNNVIQQYFPQGPISTTFLGSTIRGQAPPATFTRDSVDATLGALLGAGQLDAIDFTNTVICLLLPPGVVLTDDTAAKSSHEDEDDRDRRRRHGHLLGDNDKDSSLEGLGGYHGSALVGGKTIYFAVAVYSQFVGGKPNGIPFWPDSWKNVVATLYHELNEARTDPDVEQYNRKSGPKIIGWYANVEGGGEIGDIPMSEAGESLGLVMVEVKLASGATAPIQLMWSNAVHGPEGPFT